MPLRWASCLFRPAKGPAASVELNPSACPAELQEQLTSRGTACLRPRGAHVIYERFDDAGQGAFTPPVFIYIKRLPVCGGMEVCVKRTLVTHFVGRAAREARLQVQLHHPHLLPALASVRGRHHYYLILPAAEGDLWAEAEAMRQQGTGYDEQELREVARQILLGLEHLHASGLAHRDIKPANVLRLPDGRVAVADFGCADGCTAGFVAAGTTQFQPPECRRNANAQLAVLPKGYDQRFQDMWSVGATLASLWFATLPEVIRGSGSSRIPAAAAAAAAVADAAAAAAAAGDGHDGGSPASAPSEPAGGAGGQSVDSPATPALPRLLAVAGFAACKSTVGACGSPMSEPFLDLLSKLLKLRPSERLTASQALLHEWLAVPGGGGGGGQGLAAEAVRPVVLVESASAPVASLPPLPTPVPPWSRTAANSCFTPFTSQQQLMMDQTKSTAQADDGPACAGGPEQSHDHAHCLHTRRHPAGQPPPQQQPQSYGCSPAGCSSSSSSGSSSSSSAVTPSHSSSSKVPLQPPQTPAAPECQSGGSGGSGGSSCAKGLHYSSSSSPAGPAGRSVSQEGSSPAAASHTSRSPGEEAQQLALRQQQRQQQQQQQQQQSSPSAAASTWLLRPSPSPQASNPKRAQRAILRVFVGAGGESSGSN